MRIKIEFRRDVKTAFPCVRIWRRLNAQEPYACVTPGAAFVALLPVTKIQAEQFVWDHGFPPRELPSLLERLNLTTDTMRGRYPAEVSKLQRPSLAELRNPNELCALLATNLTVWAEARELIDRAGVSEFPTAKSEWGQVLLFLGARALHDREWLLLRDRTANIPTRRLLDKALELYPHTGDRAQVETRTVRRLLQHLARFSEEGWEGLPFLNFGGYELLGNAAGVKRLAADPDHGIVPGWEARAQVAGDSMLWPALEVVPEKNFRLLLRRYLPVVTVRPVFDPLAVRPESTTEEFELDRTPKPDTAADGPAHTRGRPDGASRRSFVSSLLKTDRSRINSLPAYADSETIQEGHCPHCREKVEAEVFNTEGVFYCWLERQEEAGKFVSRRRHSLKRPAVRADVVTRRYLDVLKNPRGNRARIVALNGFSKAGKTTWLISLAGLMNYPDGKSMLHQIFPEALNLHFSDCAVHDWGREADRSDPKLATERMWQDGLLPRRTEKDLHAARMPMHFYRGSGRTTDSLILDLSDTAGELLFDNLVSNDKFPFVPDTMDAIFFMPSLDPDNQLLKQFLAKMQTAVRNGKALNLKQLNLVLTFSKIDELKYGTEEDRALLRRMVPVPYSYPEPSMEGLRLYLDRMYDVHVALREWIRENKPQMLDVEREFASVRYCGLSSFGFASMDEKDEADFDRSIPFPPQPVRAIDPLLWLLHGNGLLRI